HVSGPYYLTTNEKMPRWTTDSSSPTSAFYEEKNFVKRYINELTMFDSPGAMAYSQMTAGLKPKQMVHSRFHASTYLIHGMDVLYCGEIDLRWTFTRTHRGLVATGIGRLENQLKPEQRARLLVQYPNVDYLPGPAIGVPQPIDEFDPVPDLDTTDWDKQKSNVRRYSEIAE